MVWNFPQNAPFFFSLKLCPIHRICPHAEHGHRITPKTVGVRPTTTGSMSYFAGESEDSVSCSTLAVDGSHGVTFFLWNNCASVSFDCLCIYYLAMSRCKWFPSNVHVVP